ncbi:uncharacterized protein LOC110105884 [Dendrobium catenatum]|uniref:DUF4408 domain-containing protein n=1 Tax=Dendrobium catenatum TaxID=906689 RepID=A0A2I0WET5_9ASPA|nr:uncharacterized protein LOC110105884 [Dendrobium catenatum]PKU74181.1 hypothetical protein MA16_Dca018968 [Dendrobium catenatum]
MEKMNKFQLVKATVLLLLLLVIPFVSSSMRPSYLYFLLNILILSLGIEAGFHAAISNPRDEKKPAISSSLAVEVFLPTSDGGIETGGMKEVAVMKKPAAMAEKIVASATIAVNKLKKCPSVPSLFFIGSYETVEEETKSEYEQEEEEEGVMEAELGDKLNAQELFSKAEMFITNFYKQLKMQREESWKRIHGFYHKAF